MLLWRVGAPSFFLLRSIPLCKCTTVFWSTHLCAFFFIATDVSQEFVGFCGSLLVVPNFSVFQFILYYSANDVCKVEHCIAIRIKTKLLPRLIIHQSLLFVHTNIFTATHTCGVDAVPSLGFYEPFFLISPSLTPYPFTLFISPSLQVPSFRKSPQSLKRTNK